MSNSLLHRAICVSALVALTAAAGLAAKPAASSAEVETEPTLKLADFQRLPPASGPGYRIDATVPVTGYQGQFTLHTDSGDIKADGSSMLKQRVAEVGPTAQLIKLSSSDVFVDALSKSAANSAKAVGAAVSHPVDTVQGVPAGIGRFFKSVGAGVSSAASSSSEGDTAGAAKDALGINKAKRQLAKNVGVDPYTTNPYLAKRLDDLANAAFAGGVSLDVVMAVSTAGVATAISVTKTVSNLAWDLPPEDVKERNDKELAALAVDEPTRTKLLNNRWFTPTMALVFVESLKTLGTQTGTTAFAALASDAKSESEARFFNMQLRMANRYAKDGDKIVAIETLGKVGAFRTASGKKLFPGPIDYLSWTQDVKEFVEGRQVETGARVAWFEGRPSPRTSAQLRERGWQVRENVPLD